MSDILSEVKREWKKDAPLDKTKLDDEALRVPYLQSKYLNYLSAAKKILRAKRFELESLQHMKKEWYGGYMTKERMDDLEWDYNPLKGRVKPLKTEMDAFVKVDPEIQAMRQEIEELEEVKDYLIDVVESVKWRHQHIRNAIDWGRFMAGA